MAEHKGGEICLYFVRLQNCVTASDRFRAKDYGSFPTFYMVLHFSFLALRPGEWINEFPFPNTSLALKVQAECNFSSTQLSAVGEQNKLGSRHCMKYSYRLVT